MRNTREILRLKYEAGLSHRMIARAVGVANSTVSDASARMKAAGLVWQDAATLSDVDLERRLYRDHEKRTVDPREPDWSRVRAEIADNKNVTLQLLWREYRREEPDGYGYSWYCERYRAWQGGLDLVMRQEHRYGERVFVDWAGDTMNVVTPGTGEIRPAYLFVAVLGASNYLYAEASLTCGTHVFLSAHCRAFSYFGGVPELVVCDNLKTGVRKPDRYEPDLHAPYAELAAHYGCAVFPARVRKPRDKAKAENGVLVSCRMIMAPLRKRVFFSLAELNEAIRTLVDAINERPFQKLPGSRRSEFMEHELPKLRPLPAEPFAYRTRKDARVHIDYHVELEGHFYSVPYHLVRERVEILFDESIVEVLHHGERVALHPRNRAKGRLSTTMEHMPEKHRAHAEWTPERITAWAASTGPATAALTEAIMSARPHPALGFRSCLGLLRLTESYGAGRVEAASARALAFGACSYKSVKSILKNRLDEVGLDTSRTDHGPAHDNVRGSDYYA